MITFNLNFHYYSQSLLRRVDQAQQRDLTSTDPYSERDDEPVQSEKRIGCGQRVEASGSSQGTAMR
jgi:hypothetical protein